MQWLGVTRRVYENEGFRVDFDSLSVHHHRQEHQYERHSIPVTLQVLFGSVQNRPQIPH